ncbi:MAG: hypothetical protein RDV48_17255 [Candidatus Eremiobacteraeota bacterium]|nr:hypothetical protein [Candidatus Eremiobacteraeota bacterium]
MHFPASDITVSPWGPFLYSFAISFFSSLGGLSGALLLVPYQLSVLGITGSSVSATNTVLSLIIAWLSFSYLLAIFRERKVRAKCLKRDYDSS